MYTHSQGSSVPHRDAPVKHEPCTALLCEVRLQLRAEAAVPHAAGRQRILPQPRPPLLYRHLDRSLSQGVVTPPVTDCQ